MSDPVMYKCPVCKGFGGSYLSMGYVFEGEIGPDTEIEWVPCTFCDGEGKITPLKLALYKAGYNKPVKLIGYL